MLHDIFTAILSAAAFSISFIIAQLVLDWIRERRDAGLWDDFFNP